MQKMYCAILMTMALLAASCSSGSAAVQDETAAVGSPDDAAARLINQLGSDDAATDALIIAMDRGYSGPQILDAVDNDDLQGDGTIQDQDPAGPPLNLVLYSLDGEDEGAYAPHTRSGQSGEVTLASFSQLRQTPIEKLRENSARHGGTAGSGTELIMQLIASRFTAADIIEVLILGADHIQVHPITKNKDNLLCAHVVDEIYCGNGERYPAETEPDEPEPASDDVEANDEAPVDADAAPALPPDTQLEWTGTFETSAETLPKVVTITRTPGTDEFTLRMDGGEYANTERWIKGICTSQWISWTTGTGTFGQDYKGDLVLVFEGDAMSQTIFLDGPCEEDEPYGLSGPLGEFLIAPDGLVYDSGYVDVGRQVLLGSPPRPIGE